MNATELGQLGLTGWRRRVANRVADPVSARTPFSPDQVQGLIGAITFALAVYYVFSTVRKAATQVRQGRQLGQVEPFPGQE